MDSKGQRYIVGLGNPGKQYEKTRHNVGFELLDRFAKLNLFSFNGVNKGIQIAEGSFADSRVFLIKPLTYMNLSGEPLAAFLRNRSFHLREIICAVDDIHLPLGTIRLRPGGSDGGHNGLKSLSAHLNSKEYARLRIGVGEPASADHQVDYVLSRFSRDEMATLDEVLDRSVAALEMWVREGIDAAMNRFNSNR